MTDPTDHRSTSDAEASGASEGRASTAATAPPTATATTPAAGTRAPRRTPQLLTTTIAIVAGLVYAFFFWAQISRLVSLSTLYPHPATPPWGLASAAVAIPVVSFVVAFVIARRRGSGAQLLIYLLGLVALAALSLSMVGFENLTTGR